MAEGRVLILEDDLASQALIKESLRGYEFFLATDITSAKKILEHNQGLVDALLIDIHLPDGDGLRFLDEVMRSESFRHIPCLILSADEDISGKVMAFSSGAEDFINKPFDPIELKARVGARIHRFRRQRQEESIHLFGNLKIDFQQQKVFLVTEGEGGASGLMPRNLDLTVKELQLLSLLVHRPETVFSREQILNSVWKGIAITDRTIDSHIARLRKKISASKVEIETLKGIGYLARLKTKN